MKNIFMEHPREVNETYLEHMGHASWYSWCFFKLFFQSLIHAIFPWIYNGAISGKVKEVNDHLTGRLGK